MLRLCVNISVNVIYQWLSTTERGVKNMSETDLGKKILKVLQDHSEENLYTKRVAELANLSPSTTAKYLGLLEKEGKVSMREQRPFKFWETKSFKV